MQRGTMENLLEIEERIYYYYSKEKMNVQEKIRQKSMKEQSDLEIIEIKKEIKSLFSEYAIIDWTDEESCCYELDILMHEMQKILDDDIELITLLGGERKDLRVFFSVIGKYYYRFLERTEYNFLSKTWSFFTINNYSKKQKQLVKILDDYMHMRKWIKITDSVARIKIPKIETELKYIGQTTVFDCLFTDKVEIERY